MPWITAFKTDKSIVALFFSLTQKVLISLTCVWSVFKFHFAQANLLLLHLENVRFRNWKKALNLKNGKKKKVKIIVI